MKLIERQIEKMKQRLIEYPEHKEFYENEIERLEAALQDLKRTAK